MEAGVCRVLTSGRGETIELAAPAPILCVCLASSRRRWLALESQVAGASSRRLDDAAGRLFHGSSARN